VNPALPAEAIEFGVAAGHAFEDLGDLDAARAAEADPAQRSGVAAALAALGVDDLDPRAGLDAAVAAGELCRAAGRVALPYPVVGVLLRSAADGLPLALAPLGHGPVVDHGDLFGAWRLAAVGGGASRAVPNGPPLATRLGPFATPVEVTGPIDADPLDVLLHLTLTAGQLLGTLERAVELAVAHVTTRIQFGKPISSFQAVQFQLADAAVAVDGLRELVRYTLWRIEGDPSGALSDALAVRLAALDASRLVLRTSQQLFGAAGVCDEYDISILVRHAQPALRLPFGAERTATALVAAVDQVGFESLFPHGARRP